MGNNYQVLLHRTTIQDKSNYSKIETNIYQQPYAKIFLNETVHLPNM